MRRLLPFVPRSKLFGAFALVAIALAGVAVGRANHMGAPIQSGRVVLQRDLVFEDRSDGAVLARAADGLIIDVFEGENGFLRGTLRGLARARRLDRLGRDLPFRLARWSDGRLTLDDPADGRRVELLAFGPTNAGVFARLLEDAR